jgi:hypothetical protein
MAAIVKPDSSPAFSSASFDAVNFLLADVRDALGPYLNVFVVTQQHWSQSAVGLATTLDRTQRALYRSCTCGHVAIHR